MNDLLIPNEITYSKRKSIALIIDRDGNLYVRAPFHTKQEDIDKFILKKSKWIISKRTENQNSVYSPLTFKKDETITLLGEKYNIVLYNGYRVKTENRTVFLPSINPAIRLKTFLINLSKTIIPKQVQHYASLFNFNYKQIKITSAISRWGSCSYNNNLNFTYKLIMCPIEVINYIVVHELCHTKEKNHSQKFWHRVEEILPNYKTQEKWLKENKKIIDVI